MNDPNQNAHLQVDAGPDTGRRVRIPEAGARIGRSSQNDVELTDPSISRFQCRVFFKPDASLWVADLGSTNETLLNGRAVIEARLKPGDVIEVGVTRLRVISDRPEGTADAVPVPAAATATPHPVDLGLASPVDAAPRRASAPRTWLWVVVPLLLLALALPLIRLAGRGRAPPPAPAAALPTLDVYYEKIEASTRDIFRYELTLSGSRLAVRVDGLADNRHVAREKDVDRSVLDSLTSDLDRSGFFDLVESYEGIAPDVYDACDLTVTVGARTRRVRVINRNQPDAFRAARELLENFARNELGLAAVALPPEKLLELARDAVLQGQKLFGEREVRYPNLFHAIRAFEEAQWYLETIEPKPDFYATAVGGLEECRRMLQQQVEDFRFQADRAVKLRDWESAARHLRIICELIPDRGDERHQQAQRQLLDVERRLQR